ncbi:ATP-binding protein [Halobaculum sp. MBLA0143]|uniref:ATP-binding protein n=1 Tax=Halobaculum sp. MBLA0143 TaxID=3079933 RepID=UPI003524B7D3
MTSFQSTLGEEEEGIADELAESQRQISIAEFFEKNKHMLGFDSGARGLVTAVKEGVDNALDACEEAGVMPDIYVEIEDLGDYYRLVIEDNGPGITREQLPKVFGKLLYGSRFHKREQSLTPDQQILIERDGGVESVPIGRLCDAYISGEGASTARIPDEIRAPSFDRDTHELSWQDVTHAIRHETDAATYEITTQRGRTTEVTGDHSVFTVDERGETREVAASELTAGDVVLAPQQLPETGRTVTSVNLLNHLTVDELTDRRMYVYGFDEETLREIETGETVRKYPNPDSDRKRYYYRYDGVDVLKDSFRSNYVEQGYLPAETVKRLGWEERASDCRLRTYQVGGEPTEVPVTVPVTEELMELLGYYVAEGHADDRQVGFTFGSHEPELVEATETAVAATVGTETTTVERERNSTRVKAFGSPLASFLEDACGDAAANKRVPRFVFDVAPEHRETFLRALHEGDGSDSHPSNELSHTTASETLARQVSALWSSLGVVASSETTTSDGYGDGDTEVHRTKVYGEDAALGDRFDLHTEAGEQAHKRIPTRVLEPIAVGEPSHQTVPDTIPGLLCGCGVGSSPTFAAEYRDRIETALAGEDVPSDRFTTRLTDYGLFTEDNEPTGRLESLWDALHSIQGFTETDLCLLEVTDVTETEPPEYVYDISVPGVNGDDENFVVANEGGLCVKNSRGQQGIGISAAVLYSQLTSGKPAKITSRPRGQSDAQYFELIIDTDENEPDIRREEHRSWDRYGTRIELEMEANMRARSQLRDYIQETAVVNPHARLELDEPGLDEPMKFERATDDLPAETEEIRPHPHGVELGTLIKMLESTESYSLSGFLQEEFTRVGKKSAASIIEGFMDRHVGRELGWSAPGSAEPVDLGRAVEDAVANKGAEATAAFADRVADTLQSRERTSRSQVVDVVGTVADDVAEEYDTTFGDTVRENAVAAAWAALTAFGETIDVSAGADRREDGGEFDLLTPDLYTVVDDATTTQKDDEVVHGVATRLARRIADHDDGHRLTRARLRGYVDGAADDTQEYDDATFGDTARENVTEALWDRTVAVPDDPPKVSTVAGERDTASALLEAMRATDVISPPTDCLAPITEELVEEGLRKEFDADFYAAATRDAEVSGGDPFVVEAGIAYGGELEDGGQVDVLRFANRVPLVYQRGACATTDVVKRIGWRNYGLDHPGGSGLPNGPAVISVHVASTNVPFTSESKDAVANVPEIEDEIELAIREAARDLKSFLNERRSLRKRRQKQDVLGRILPEMAEKVAEVTDRDRPEIGGALARIMNNVAVETERDGETVTVAVRNHTDTTESPDVTAVLSAEPAETPEGATVVEVDGEWFLKWHPEVAGGETETVAVDLPTDATVELSVDGVTDEKLTTETDA